MKMLQTFRLLIFIFLRFYVVRSTKRVFKIWLVSLSQFLLQRDTHYLSTSSKYHVDGGQTKKLWTNSFFPCLIFLSISGTNFYLNVVQARNIQLIIWNIKMLVLESDNTTVKSCTLFYFKMLSIITCSLLFYYNLHISLLMRCKESKTVLYGTNVMSRLQ